MLITYNSSNRKRKKKLHKQECCNSTYCCRCNVIRTSCLTRGMEDELAASICVAWEPVRNVEFLNSLVGALFLDRFNKHTPKIRKMTDWHAEKVAEHALPPPVSHAATLLLPHSSEDEARAVRHEWELVFLSELQGGLFAASEWGSDLLAAIGSR